MTAALTRRGGSSTTAGVLLVGGAAAVAGAALLRTFPPMIGWALTVGAVGALLLAGFDVATRRLPNVGTGALAGVGVVVAGVLCAAGEVPSLWPVVTAGAGFLVVGIVEALPADSIGGGDAKLLGALGVWTGLAGWPGLLPTLLTIHVVMVAALLIGRAGRGGRRVVLGPAIALGAVGGWVLTGLLSG